MSIDVDSSVLWLGVGRGVRVIGSGDIGRILAFLVLWEKFKPPKRSKHTG